MTEAKPQSVPSPFDLLAAVNDPLSVNELAGELWLKRGGGQSTKEEQDSDWKEAEEMPVKVAENIGLLISQRR